LLQVILLLDVDFVVTDRLHEQLSAAAAAEALADDLTIHKHAVVLPAFETSPQLSLPAGHSAALQAVSSECRDHFTIGSPDVILDVLSCLIPGSQLQHA